MTPVHVVELDEVTSTQDEAARRLEAGQVTPFAVTARRQSRGRGRLGRPFASPRGASLALTYAHRTSLDPADRGWFPLAAGLAALAAIGQASGPSAEPSPPIGLKWPNDLHTADGRKLGGILAEARGPEGVLIGIGMNLRGPVLQADGQEVPGAAWLRGPGGERRAEDEESPARIEAFGVRLGRALAEALRTELTLLESARGDGVEAGLHERYTMTCLTLGQGVRVDPLGVAGAGGALPPALHGTASRIDDRGRLVLDLEGGEQRAVDVGDVRHLRPGEPARSTTVDAERIRQEERGT